MEESFKQIPEFPDYMVSNFGRVKTMARQVRYVHSVTNEEHFRNTNERFLKIQFNNLTGYKFHQLYRDKKMYNKTVHQLVASAFLPKISGKDFINHIDGNKHNNIVSNLEWCTNEYNHTHATLTGLTAKGEMVASSVLNDRSVYAIKYLLSIGVSHSDMAKAFLVSRPSISLISSGKTWKHITI